MEAYTEDEVDGATRVYLNLSPELALLRLLSSLKQEGAPCQYGQRTL